MFTALLFFLLSFANSKLPSPSPSDIADLGNPDPQIREMMTDKLIKHDSDSLGLTARFGIYGQDLDDFPEVVYRERHIFRSRMYAHVDSFNNRPIVVLAMGTVEDQIFDGPPLDEITIFPEGH
jgi:hypothetical protein